MTWNERKVYIRGTVVDCQRNSSPKNRPFALLSRKRIALTHLKIAQPVGCSSLSKNGDPKQQICSLPKWIDVRAGSFSQCMHAARRGILTNGVAAVDSFVRSSDI